MLTSLWMGPLFPTIFGLSLERLDPADIEVGMCMCMCTACALHHVHRTCTAYIPQGGVWWLGDGLGGHPNPNPNPNQVGSAGLVMAVVGGAAVTPLTAAVADGVSLRAAFATVPTACFLL